MCRVARKKKKMQEAQLNFNFSKALIFSINMPPNIAWGNKYVFKVFFSSEIQIHLNFSLLNLAMISKCNTDKDIEINLIIKMCICAQLCPTLCKPIRRL